MGSPVAFGDIVAAIQTVYVVARSLRDHGGARDDYQRFFDHVGESISMIQKWEAINNSLPQYDDSVGEIKARASSMAKKVEALRAKLLPYGEKLGKTAPSGWHKGVPKKMRYLMKKKELEAFYSELEKDALQLDRHLNFLNTELNSVSLGLLLRQEARAQVLPTAPILAVEIIPEAEVAEPPPTIARRDHAALAPGGSQLRQFDPRNTEERRAMLRLLPVCLYHEILLIYSHIGIGLLCLLRLLATPTASISMLQSDNFHLEDALGKSHSLNLNHFGHWDVLLGLLRAEFPPDVPGSRKANSGQYCIISIDAPRATINRDTWRHHIGPRKRFRMAILISSDRLLGSTCKACGQLLQPTVPVSCPNSACSISLTLLPRPRISAVVRLPESATTFSSRSQPPVAGNDRVNLPIRPGGFALQVPTTIRSATERLENLCRLNFQLRAIDRGMAWSHESIVGSEMAQAQWAQTNHTVDDTLESSREKKEMRFFRSMCVKDPHSLYDAVCTRDFQLAKNIMKSGIDVDSYLGVRGTTLAVAVLQLPPDMVMVRLLLQAHADPIMKEGSMGTPLDYSAAYATDDIFNVIIEAVLKLYGKNPIIYQQALDSALVHAVGMDCPTSRLCMLLLAGANPLAGVNRHHYHHFGFSSVFDEAMRRDGQIVATRKKTKGASNSSFVIPYFLAELWYRRLLNSHEIAVLLSDPDQESRSIQGDSWAADCARELEKGSSGMLQDHVSSRMKGPFCTHPRSRPVTPLPLDKDFLRIMETSPFGGQGGVRSAPENGQD